MILKPEYETLYWFDCPMLIGVGVVDDPNAMLVAVIFDDFDTNGGYNYLAAKISKRQYDDLKNNRLFVADAFKKPVYREWFYLSIDSTPCKVKPVKLTKQIRDKCFPGDGFYLSNA